MGKLSDERLIYEILSVVEEENGTRDLSEQCSAEPTIMGDIRVIAS